MKPLTGQIPLEVVVFIDYQNTYNDARRAFIFQSSGPAAHGQINPIRLGNELVSRRPLGTTAPRNLKEVRIYRGRPASSKEPKTYGAHMRQCAAWETAGPTVVHRPLRYPRDWPATKSEEKGIDVQLALDIVTMSIRGELDIAILFSTDTDLRPALEAFSLLKFDAPRRIEVATWKSPAFKKALRVDGQHVWCHFLEEKDFRSVRDTRDYNVKRR